MRLLLSIVAGVAGFLVTAVILTFLAALNAGGFVAFVAIFKGMTGWGFQLIGPLARGIVLLVSSAVGSIVGIFVYIPSNRSPAD